MPLPSFMMRREAMTTSTSVLGSPGVAESLAIAPLSVAMADGPAAPTRPMSLRTSSEAKKLERRDW